jgi:hypothetical protein
MQAIYPCGRGKPGMGNRVEDMPSPLRSVAVRSFLSLMLSLLLGLPLGSPLGAQQRPPVRAKLNIVVIEGEGAVNNVGKRAVPAPIVKVADQDGRPVAGAAVTFFLPDSGPSGVFAHGARSLLVRTDKAGRASAKGLRANDTQGKFQIRVQASLRDLTTTASITQVNSILTARAKAGGRSGRRTAIYAGIGAAAAVGLILLIRNKTSESGGPIISLGTTTVGAPK